MPSNAATNNIIHQTELALDVTAQVMPLLEELFDLPFVLPKLDSLVVSLILRYFYASSIN